MHMKTMTSMLKKSEKNRGSLGNFSMALENGKSTQGGIEPNANPGDLIKKLNPDY